VTQFEAGGIFVLEQFRGSRRGQRRRPDCSWMLWDLRPPNGLINSAKRRAMACAGFALRRAGRAGTSDLRRRGRISGEGGDAVAPTNAGGAELPPERPRRCDGNTLPAQ